MCTANSARSHLAAALWRRASFDAALAELAGCVRRFAPRLAAASWRPGRMTA